MIKERIIVFKDGKCYSHDTKFDSRLIDEMRKMEITYVFRGAISLDVHYFDRENSRTMVIGRRVEDMKIREIGLYI